MFVLVRQGDGKYYDTGWEFIMLLRLPDVTVDRGVNGKLSQETMKTNGA